MRARRSIVIDCFPDSVKRYREGYAVVAIDVIRATTTAVTAIAMGRRCFPAPTLDAAFDLKSRLANPLLVGELGGKVPDGFEMTNSPSDIAALEDIGRPMILLSSSGTQLMSNLKECEAGYVACLRNYGATAAHLAENHDHVAVIGAGSLGEFREEDQLCCSWIGWGLAKAGYEPENDRTVEVIDRWKDAPVEACAKGNSAGYLRRSGQLKDLDFVLAHVNDIGMVCVLRGNEVVGMPVPRMRMR